MEGVPRASHGTHVHFIQFDSMFVRIKFPLSNLLIVAVAVPPHLKGDGMYDITLKKGRPIRYDLWFGGEPAPNVEWLREGRTLGPDENTSIELYSKNTI